MWKMLSRRTEFASLTECKMLSIHLVGLTELEMVRLPLNPEMASDCDVGSAGRASQEYDSARTRSDCEVRRNEYLTTTVAE